MIETGNFSARDGLRLFWRAYPAQEGKIPVVVIHGFAEHSGRYNEILQELHQNGFGALAFDLRGHGNSDGKRGFIDSFNDYVDDLNAAIEFSLQRFKTDKVIVLAHSMGALVATQLAHRKPEKILGMVLSSPLFGIKIEVPRWKKKLSELMSKYWPSCSLPNQIDSNLLTHDKVKAEAYSSDPLIFHHVCARWFEEIGSVTSESDGKADQLSMPFLMQLSEQDHIVSYAKSCEWFENTSNVDKKLIVYKGFFHEIYNERERQKPIGDFLAWMLERWPTQKVATNGTPSDSSHGPQEDQAQAG